MLSAATFRAMREGLGLSQAYVAEETGVSAQTVKRWESGRYPVPDDVSEWIILLKHRSDEVVIGAFESLMEAGAEGTVDLSYYRTQEEFAELGRDGGFFGIANANSRRVAALLESQGIKCEFHYLGECDVVEFAKDVSR